ncbi:hypothetical protein EES41_06420 [Streptomyces sp. ADI95-16]|uniref:hypothetical protein n=1 Tax=Streptomyces sp. ADI95-16 TaxID=1522758 RepID=UPI000F3AA22F|nr:hypothetical protein [Streptomyces sp. ADI95-16]AYV26353.1 hypothetical protein EES41_06420 [Streptomyces sp. ADI95-16]
MGGQQDKHHEPGKNREEQERMGSGQDPVHPGVHPGAGQEGARGKSPEELKRRGQDEMKRERDEDETRDEEH